MKHPYNTYLKSIIRVAFMLLLAVSPYGCEWAETTGPKQVFILYSIGYNNLNSYLKADIEELTRSFSSIGGNRHVVIYSHSLKEEGDYTTPNSPTISELCKDKNGNVSRETLLTLEPETISPSKETLHRVLSFIYDKYQEAEYTIMFTSHGTGWTPADYCNNSSYYENQFSGEGSLARTARQESLPYWGIVPDDGGPVVKSFGVQNISSSSYYEMNIADMAEAFPMKMATVIFDACLMGGIEVAYEFRKITDMLVASQTEILADGMDYTTTLKYIFNNDIKGFCQNYFDHYNSQTGSYQSATISLVDCTRLEPLAEICRDIFNTKRSEIAALEGSLAVQRYYRLSNASIHKWFYDLEDIAIKSGISQEQEEQLKTALEGCILYKAATKKFINDIVIQNHCGLSMYLPFSDRGYLNNFYKSLDWNQATGLVQ